MGRSKKKKVPLGYFVLGLRRRDGTKQCMVGRGKKIRKNAGLCDLDSSSFLPGLSLQEAAAQKVYQVRGNSKEARWARRGTDPPREMRESKEQEVESGSNLSLSLSAR